MNPRNGALNGVAVKVGQLDAGQGQDGHIAVGQEIHVARVVQDARNIGGHKGLALAHTDDHRRTEPRGNDLVRFEGRQDAQSKGPGEPLDGAADGHFKSNRLAGRIRVQLNLLDEVGNDLGVGLGDEFVALRDEFALQIEIVLHNAVVDYDHAAGAVAVGVGVLFRGASVRGPARVADAEGALDRMLAQNLFQVAELARSATDLKRGAGRAAHGDACRVVAAVFEAPQPLDDDGNYLLGTDITDNAAHATILSDTAASVFLFVFFGLVFFGLVVWAAVLNVAGGTLERIRAGAGFRTQLITAGGVGHGVHCRDWDDVRSAFDILRGDLEGVEKEAGTARVKLRGAQGVENLGEGDLDGAAVLQDRELEGFFRGAGRPCGEAVQAGVEVAIRLTAEGGRVAFDAVRHDVATFVTHFGSLPTPTPSLQGSYLFSMGCSGGFALNS